MNQINLKFPIDQVNSNKLQTLTECIEQVQVQVVDDYYYLNVSPPLVFTGSELFDVPLPLMRLLIKNISLSLDLHPNAIMADSLVLTFHLKMNQSPLEHLQVLDDLKGFIRNGNVVAAAQQNFMVLFENGNDQLTPHDLALFVEDDTPHYLKLSLAVDNLSEVLSREVCLVHLRDRSFWADVFDWAMERFQGMDLGESDLEQEIWEKAHSAATKQLMTLMA